MARVVVVGGGLAGTAAAARLAKQHHDVTLVEAAGRIGGALGRLIHEDHAWDAGAAHTLVPAALRDLFRKSGRPLERELDLVPLSPVRRHLLADGTALDEHGGSRSATEEAVEEALGVRTARSWTAYLDGFGPVWDALRTDWLERPWSRTTASKETRELVDSRLSLERLTRRRLRDPRLRDVATWGVELAGHDPRLVPALWGVWAHAERSFGAWTVDGGLGQLAPVLAGRLATRGVEVLTGVRAHDLVLRGERVRAVLTDAGELDADVVVVAMDPRRLPALASYVARTTSTIPPHVTHVGLDAGVIEDLPPEVRTGGLPHEVVLHGEPLLVVRTGGTAPDGGHAWTMLSRGRTPGDPVATLGQAGWRLRPHLRVRVDRSPRQLAEEWNGSPDGVLWAGRGTLRERIGTRTPVPGVYTAGAHTVPGAGIAQVTLSAALAVQAIAEDLGGEPPEDAV